MSGSITANGYAPVDPIRSQDEFEQKAALCKEHRGSNSQRGSFLFFIQENEKTAHNKGFPAIRLVVNLYSSQTGEGHRELAKMLVVNKNPFQWYAQYHGDDGKNVIPLVAFNYDPSLGNIYVPRNEIGQEYRLGDDTSGLLDGGQFHIVMSGVDAKKLYKKIHFIDYERLIAELMEETLANAPLDGYDMAANLAKWSDLGARAHADYPDDFPYSATAVFTEPVSAETVKAFKLCSLASLQNVDMTSTTEWDADLPSLRTVTPGVSFPSLVSWSGRLPNLEDGGSMFSDAAALSSFSGNLSSLSLGAGMFSRCRGLVSWDVALPKLTEGTNMFYMSGLQSWNTDLPKLGNGVGMFEESRLSSFSGSLGSLVGGERMFRGTPLTAWTQELPSLETGTEMFKLCTSMEECAVDLSSLKWGNGMFEGCTSF